LGPKVSSPSSSPQEGQTGSNRQGDGSFHLPPPNPVSPPHRSVSNVTTQTWSGNAGMTTSGGANGGYYNDELAKKYPYHLGISKHYFEFMEEQSGKDYRWIKPLTQPVSQLML
jgi:hypothetical protein